MELKYVRPRYETVILCRTEGAVKVLEMCYCGMNHFKQTECLKGNLFGITIFRLHSHDWSSNNSVNRMVSGTEEMGKRLNTFILGSRLSGKLADFVSTVQD